MADELPPEQDKNIREAIFAGNTIEAMFARKRSQKISLATPIFWGAIAALAVYVALKWA